MPFDAHKNFAYSTVVVAPSPASSGTSLTVQGSTGTRFPAVPFNAVVCPFGQVPVPTNAEVVRVTSIVGDLFTIVRTQEGSAARTIVAGDQIFAAITAKTLTDIETALNSGGTYVLLNSVTEQDGGTGKLTLTDLTVANNLILTGTNNIKTLTSSIVNPDLHILTGSYTGQHRGGDIIITAATITDNTVGAKGGDITLVAGSNTSQLGGNINLVLGDSFTQIDSSIVIKENNGTVLGTINQDGADFYFAIRSDNLDIRVLDGFGSPGSKHIFTDEDKLHIYSPHVDFNNSTCTFVTGFTSNADCVIEGTLATHRLTCNGIAVAKHIDFGGGYYITTDEDLMYFNASTTFQGPSTTFEGDIFFDTNVGIGTSSATASLDVRGTFKFESMSFSKPTSTSYLIDLSNPASSLTIAAVLGFDLWSDGGSISLRADSGYNILLDTYGQVRIGDNGGSYVTIQDGHVKIPNGASLYVNNIKVVGSQGAAVADATSTSDIVAQFNTLLARIRTHGLIAT